MRDSKKCKEQMTKREKNIMRESFMDGWNACLDDIHDRIPPRQTVKGDE